MRDVAKRVGWGLLPVVFAIVLWLGMKAQDAPQAQERQSVTAAVVAPPVPALTSELDEIRARIQAADDRAHGAQDGGHQLALVAEATVHQRGAFSHGEGVHPPFHRLDDHPEAVGRLALEVVRHGDGALCHHVGKRHQGRHPVWAEHQRAGIGLRGGLCRKVIHLALPW